MIKNYQDCVKNRRELSYSYHVRRSCYVIKVIRGYAQPPRSLNFTVFGLRSLKVDFFGMRIPLVFTVLVYHGRLQIALDID